MTSTHKIAFSFHHDPGHGWLEVDWTDLKAVGLNPTDFSRYSYRKGNTFYLEEDCDCQKFITAYQNKFDHSPHIAERNDGQFIRNLPRIHG